MKCSLFSTKSPGRLVKIDQIDDDTRAFVPDELPPNWRFPEHLWPALAEAKQKAGVLEGLGRTLPNPGILLRPLEDREAIKSSALEGT